MPVFTAIAESVGERPFPTASMKVLERFQGAPPDQFTAVSDPLCGGLSLEVGRTYLLYETVDSSKRVMVGGCNRSHRVGRSDEDLDFWRSYAKGESKSVIRGTVTRDLDRNAKDREEYDAVRPIKDVPVLITGEGRTYKTQTNALGEYTVLNAAPGGYSVEPALEGHQATFFPSNLGTLSEGGCIVRNFTMHVDRTVRGIVRDSKGAPAAGVYVQMVHTDPAIAEESQQLFLSISEPDGSFSFERVWPGSYYLGANIDNTPSPKYPHPATYYPGTTEIRLAAPIVFTQSPAAYEVDFRLPAPLLVVRVRGRVVLENGEPARGPDGLRLDVREPDGFGQVDASIKLADDGQFEVELSEGVTYSLRAYTGGLPGAASELVTFIASKETSLQLTLRDRKSEPR